MRKWFQKKAWRNASNLFTHPKRLSIFKASLVLALFVSIACEKDTEDLGSNLIDDEGFTIVVRDDIEVITYTKLRDSIATSRAADALRFIIGRSDDPDFGKSESTVYSQLRPQALSPDFGTNARVDSVWLTLELESPPFAQNLTQPFDFEVHRLAEKYDGSIVYYSNQELEVEDDPIGVLNNYTVNFKKKTNVGDTSIAVIKIPLDNAYFEDLIVNPASNDPLPNELTDLNSFLEYFKGIRIKCTSGEGYIYVNGYSNQTAIRIYYSNDDTVSSTGQFRLLAGNDNNFFMNYAHDLSQSSADFSLQDTITGMDKLYVSAMGGPTAYVYIPEIETFRDSLPVINRCILRFPIESGSQAKHVAPQLISGFSGNQIIRDFQEEFIWTQNGERIRGEVRNGYYEINITQFLMNALVKEKPLTFGLLPFRGNSTANRVILGGNKNPERKLEITLYYTKPIN
ncbi:MAG: DUF4270 family protein [Cryomorphaceae bacterium]|nr:DUF4270 family protein [Cryomorphaceae bacterium]